MQSSTLQFLRNLEKNNNREWFNDNKTLYQEAQQDVISFVEKLIEEMVDFDEEMGKLEAKKSVFRIYRDTRFSKDKTPYKTNFAIISVYDCFFTIILIILNPFNSYALS